MVIQVAVPVTGTQPLYHVLPGAGHGLQVPAALPPSGIHHSFQYKLTFPIGCLCQTEQGGAKTGQLLAEGARGHTLSFIKTFLAQPCSLRLFLSLPLSRSSALQSDGFPSLLKISPHFLLSTPLPHQSLEIELKSNSI